MKKKTIYAKYLRAGDVLEPDGTQVIAAEPEGHRIAITIRAPGKEARRYVVDEFWPLVKRKPTPPAKEEVTQ